MDIKNLSEKAKEFGIWVHIFNKKLFLTIADNMTEHENILFMTKGHDLKTSYKYPVIITDRAVYVAKYATLYGRLKNWVIPIDYITRIFMAKAILFYAVVISIEGDALVITRLPKRKADKIMEILTELRNRIDPKINS